MTGGAGDRSARAREFAGRIASAVGMTALIVGLSLAALGAVSALAVFASELLCMLAVA